MSVSEPMRRYMAGEITAQEYLRDISALIRSRLVEDALPHVGDGYNPKCHCPDCTYVRNSTALAGEYDDITSEIQDLRTDQIIGEAEIPIYPGPHPGTGRNDHGPHSWEQYRVLTDGGKIVIIRACQMCGWPHPDDATLGRYDA